MNLPDITSIDNVAALLLMQARGRVTAAELAGPAAAVSGDARAALPHRRRA